MSNKEYIKKVPQIIMLLFINKNKMSYSLGIFDIKLSFHLFYLCYGRFNCKSKKTFVVHGVYST